jgi:DnaJ-class molecular chaperone
MREFCSLGLQMAEMTDFGKSQITGRRRSILETGRNMHKKAFDPEKYHMALCPSCYGHGFIEYHEGRNVCSKCGGFGLIKIEDDSEEKGKVDREVY